LGTGTGLTVTWHPVATPEAIGEPEANLVIFFLQPGKICWSRTTIHPGNQGGCFGYLFYPNTPQLSAGCNDAF
jgi:hypothetical protein